MRIAIVDYTTWDYRVASAYQMPLGGSQSAICYLSEELARLGHDVYLLNATSLDKVSRGVRCLAISRAPASLWTSCDAVIVQNLAKRGQELRPLLSQHCKLVFWTQHAQDQPAVQSLRQQPVRDAYDGLAFVSQWQMGEYVREFGVDSSRSRVLRNAIGPAFQSLLKRADDPGQFKTRPPVLAYTSTPFRGLDLLLQAFPALLRAMPGITLRVYSSMRVYQHDRARDEAQFGHLYRLCREMPGVQYVGSLTQPELAQELKQVSILAYPNHFPETSCIAIMEALAAGCRVVTSRLGALPETCQGFARLVAPSSDGEGYLRGFTEATQAALAECLTPGASQRLTEQVATIQATCNWLARGVEWSDWLQSLG